MRYYVPNVWGSSTMYKVRKNVRTELGVFLFKGKNFYKLQQEIKETFIICSTLDSFKYNPDWRTESSIRRAKKGEKDLKIKQTLPGDNLNHALQENDDDDIIIIIIIIMPKSTTVNF